MCGSARGLSSGVRFASPVFDGTSEDLIREQLLDLDRALDVDAKGLDLGRCRAQTLSVKRFPDRLGFGLALGGQLDLQRRGQEAGRVPGPLARAQGEQAQQGHERAANGGGHDGTSEDLLGRAGPRVERVPHRPLRPCPRPEPTGGRRA